MKTRPQTVQTYFTFLKKVYETAKRQEPLDVYGLASDFGISCQAAEAAQAFKERHEQSTQQHIHSNKAK